SNKAVVLAEAAHRRAEAAEARARKAEARLEKIKAVSVTKNGVTKQVQGFVDFLREQSVVGLAIGLVLGTQVKAVVDQMIASFFNPLIGLLLPGRGSLDEKLFKVHLFGKTGEFEWGKFASTMITFIIVAAVVYYVFKGLGLDKLDKKKES
ncbi:MAG TPA: MscL family protein, partial [Candidatus Saccharimonadales bacterium]|nr:MscL family protein [Candidatus Saccharimonadales bacterium]